MNNTAFTHNPAIGMSIGARSHQGMLYVAFALTNNGLSLKGHFIRGRRDQFSRAVSRAIINGRIDNAINNNVLRSYMTWSDDLTILSFISDISARDLIQSIRPYFKYLMVRPDDASVLLEEMHRVIIGALETCES